MLAVSPAINYLINYSLITGRMWSTYLKHMEWSSVACAMLSIATPSSGEPVVFWILMALVGVPHGALDHLVWLQGDDAAEPSVSTWISFLSQYLAIMALYATVWIISSRISVLVFIAVACFHFGETELDFFSENKKQSFPFWFRFFIGWTFLFQILLLHLPEAFHILNPIIQFSFQFDSKILMILMLTHILSFVLIEISVKTGSLSEAAALKLSLTILVFLGINLVKSLLMSFAMFYGIGHSIKSLAVYKKQFRLSRFSLARNLIPFSLISVSGIALMIQFTSTSKLLTFFQSLSVIALPHILLSSRLPILFQKSSSSKLIILGEAAI